MPMTNATLEQTDRDTDVRAHSPAETVIVRQEELDLVKSDAAAIKRARLVAPRLGEPHFGRIHVEYAVPRLRKRR